MLLTERSKLLEQYQRATVDSGRFEELERKRFLSHLLEKLKSYRNMVSLPVAAQFSGTPSETMARKRASHQGREMASTLSFILDDLRTRVGARTLQSHLAASGSRDGLALARRLATPRSQSALRLAALRVLSKGQEIVAPLEGSLLEAGECARYDLTPPANARVDIAIAIDNTGACVAWYSGVELRVQAQTARGGELHPTSLRLFGSVRRIEKNRRSWVAFPGVDLLAEIRAELSPCEDIYALRLLITRK